MRTAVTVCLNGIIFEWTQGTDVVRVGLLGGIGPIAYGEVALESGVGIEAVEKTARKWVEDRDRELARESH